MNKTLLCLLLIGRCWAPLAVKRASSASRSQGLANSPGETEAAQAGGVCARGGFMSSFLLLSIVKKLVRGFRDARPF